MCHLSCCVWFVPLPYRVQGIFSFNFSVTSLQLHIELSVVDIFVICVFKFSSLEDHWLRTRIIGSQTH